MSEKQKNWGVTVLVSEIKRVGNAVFLEVLVMKGDIGFLATRIKIVYVEAPGHGFFFHFFAIGLFYSFFVFNFFSSGKISLTEG